MCSYKAYADTRQPCTLMTLTRASHTLYRLFLPLLFPYLTFLTPPNTHTHTVPQTVVVSTSLEEDSGSDISVGQEGGSLAIPPPPLAQKLRYLHTHIHSYTHTHMHPCTQAHMHTCTHAHVCTCMYIHIQIWLVLSSHTTSELRYPVAVYIKYISIYVYMDKLSYIVS